MKSFGPISLALCITAALYWLGLKGPFLLDDASALGVVFAWHRGESSWQEVILGNGSLLFSRPVAMASFLLTAWLGGIEAWSFKLGNLLIHLLCGVLVWRIGRRVFALDKRLSLHAETLALLLTSIWLLHPLHVSTVLYAVQRMAQLSTLFSLAAVLAYLGARKKLAAGETRQAVLTLFVGFPFLMLAGMFSKQNAAVAAFLCMAFELAYFTRQGKDRQVLQTFYGLFIGLPILAVATILAIQPESLLAAYAEWDFSLQQRLLTQPRALMDYVGTLLVPRGPRMGLYTDDFAVSTSLWSPPSTLVAITALLLVSALAVLVRNRAPSVFAGWFFFLAAHAVESTFLPLEMYYEHRNYLPSVGLFLAVIGLMGWIIQTIPTSVLSPRKLGTAASFGFIVTLAVALFGRVLVWQDANIISQQALRVHPESLRASFDAADLAIARKDFDYHDGLMRRVAQSPDPRHRQMARLQQVYLNCQRGVRGNRELMEKAVTENLSNITVVQSHILLRVSELIQATECPDLSRSEMAGYMRRIVDSAWRQPEWATPKWTSRYLLAQAYVHAGQWPEALQQAELAWQASRNKKVGVFLVLAYFQRGRPEEASRTLHLVEPLIPPYDRAGQSVLAYIRSQVTQQGAKSEEGTMTHSVGPGLR